MSYNRFALVASQKEMVRVYVEIVKNCTKRTIDAYYSRKNSL